LEFEGGALFFRFFPETRDSLEESDASPVGFKMIEDVIPEFLLDGDLPA